MILQAFYYLIYCLSESKGMLNKMCNLKQIPFYLAMKRKKIFKNQLQVLVGLVCLFFGNKEHCFYKKICLVVFYSTTFRKRSLQCPLRCCYNEDSYVFSVYMCQTSIEMNLVNFQFKLNDTQLEVQEHLIESYSSTITNTNQFSYDM